MYFETKTLKTERLTVAYHRAGCEGLPKLLLVHGNCSSSLFYQPLMKRLEDKYDMIAIDLRCFGESDALYIDATRGLRDFSDDIDSFVSAIGWDKFSILGWSMGGGVCMQYALDHADKLEKIILQAPLSPFGFGGTYDEDGKKLEPVGLGSGAGTVNPQLVAALRDGGREFAATTIDSLYVVPEFKVSPEYKDMFIDSVLSTKVGEGMYPGDMVPAAVWPFVCAGVNGINNTMAPNYCDLSGIADIPVKPDILWIYGDRDLIVSDTSMCDVGFLGQIGVMPGWPGLEACPPQPMWKQTRYVLEKYKANGGFYREAKIAGGHGCMLDNEDAFVEELVAFMAR